MTATITTRPLSSSSDSLLRFAMRADATLCAGTGLLVSIAADPLSRLSGLSATSEWIAGAALVVYGAALVRARRGTGHPAHRRAASSPRTWCSPSSRWASWRPACSR